VLELSKVEFSEHQAGVRLSGGAGMKNGTDSIVF